MPSSEIRETLADLAPEAVMLSDDMDSALLGYANVRGDGFVAVYDADRVVEIFAEQGMDLADAKDHFHYNVEGAWVGRGTPVFVWTPAT